MLFYKPLSAAGGWEGKKQNKPGDLPVEKQLIFAFGGKANDTMKNKIILLCFLVGIQPAFAQNDTVQLEEALLSDSYFLRFSETQSKIILSDSILERNSSSLTSLLNYNSSVYFKENGLGMVSSPSFRGTTAQQTAVVWNGININSAFLGQTDFNTVNPKTTDQIIVKPGGGSVVYGSSAIGGSIHLNDELNFSRAFKNTLLANYGSFNSYGLNFGSQFSTDVFSFNVKAGRNGLDNNYKFPGTDEKNLNGQFYNNSLNISAGYKIDPSNIIKIYGNLYDGERHFSLISSNATKTKYHDYSNRALAEWNGFFGKFISKLKIAYLNEEYRYYPTLETKNFNFGKAQSAIVKYDLGFSLHKNIFLNTIFDFTGSKGETDSYSSDRKTGSASIMMKHQVGRKFLYEASLRKEITDNYGAPFLYSLGIKYDLTNFYRITFNTSKNFRAPTFNDLSWPGAGNPDLNPEISYQAEIGNQLYSDDLSVQVTAYYNFVKDMIRWVPAGGGLSAPENTAKVRIYGLESVLKYKKNSGSHFFELNGTYAYNISENLETQTQLIYAPYHKATASLGYSWNRISSYYQFLYTGKVFTDSTNKNELNAYTVSNLGLELSLGKKHNYKLGVQVLNLLDEEYENVLSRPMPGTNFSFYLNFKL